MKFKQANIKQPVYDNPDVGQTPPKLELIEGVHGTSWQVTEKLPQHDKANREKIAGATTNCKNVVEEENLNTDYDWKLCDAFIMRVTEEVTRGCRLPFAVPKTRVPQIVERVAKYWFTHSDLASEERWFVIRDEDLRGHQNKLIQLPSQIISISDVQMLNAGATVSMRKANFLLERLLTNSISFYTSVTNNVSFNYAGPNGVQSTNYTEDLFLGMYEVNTLNAILKRTVRFAFNQMTHKLNVLGDNEGCDLVLLTFTRVPLATLFNEQEFLNHVVGECMIELEFVMGAFDYKLPGGVTLNLDKYKSTGEKLVEDAKKYIEDNQAGDVFDVLDATS